MHKNEIVLVVFRVLFTNVLLSASACICLFVFISVVMSVSLTVTVCLPGPEKAGLASILLLYSMGAWCTLWGY